MIHSCYGVLLCTQTMKVLYLYEFDFDFDLYHYMGSSQLSTCISIHTNPAGSAYREHIVLTVLYREYEAVVDRNYIPRSAYNFFTNSKFWQKIACRLLMRTCWEAKKMLASLKWYGWIVEISVVPPHLFSPWKNFCTPKIAQHGNIVPQFVCTLDNSC
jgi:hypothetical protein